MEKETRSEAYYLDDDHIIVDPDKTTMVVINEYDENGDMIRETWGFTGNMHRKIIENQKPRNDVTPSLPDFIKNGSKKQPRPVVGDEMDDDIQRIGMIASKAVVRKRDGSIQEKFYVAVFH